jgi:alanine racemase
MATARSRSRTTPCAAASRARASSTSAEALELRQAAVRVPILVLARSSTTRPRRVPRRRAHRVHSSDRRAMLQELARSLRRRAKVHLKIDTGMRRLGVLPSRALDLLREIRASSHLELAGVMTHVSAGEGAHAASTAEQARLFEAVLREARAENLLAGWIHMANSACIFTDLRPRYDTVRPGIAAYGVLSADLPGAGDLRPILSLRTQIVFLKDVPAHAAVGYSSTWSAERATRVATLPVGYNDGVPWRLSNRGCVLVRGQRAPIVGRVTMDYITVDVGHIRACASATSPR